MQGSGFQNDRYFSRSWAMLTRDKGWVKPVLVLAVAWLVPVVGPLALLGYCLEWVRLTAWNVDSAPKQHDVRVGELIKSGWRGFVVALGWGVMIWLVGTVLGYLFSWNDGVQSFVRFCWSICTIFIAIVEVVAQIRATIYQDFKAGFRLDRIWQMVSHDFGGIARIAGIAVLGGLAVCAILLVMVVCFFISWVPTLITYGSQLSYLSYYSGSAMTAGIIQMVLSMLAGMAPVLVIGIFACAFVGILFELVVVNACGLWLRQFDVPAWGNSDAELPQGTLDVPATAATAPVPPEAPMAPVAPEQPVEPERPMPVDASMVPEQTAVPVSPTPTSGSQPTPAAESVAPAPEAPAQPTTPAPEAHADEQVTPIIVPPVPEQDATDEPGKSAASVDESDTSPSDAVAGTEGERPGESADAPDEG
ncbi:MAG: DUF4013 domain-containing protein [Atopobiaceae bacterium]|jgi:hypothetical protein|nr:DUF4013 domain-containing protein [Atopobiaceae bacterium]MCI1260394.1 DUF4013 domain-containing protein [Atopobiaceae bacterium]MDD2587815.1 DUF4013 domain-containing protein [Atopobiaceae bacterium]MDD3176167.1 DUF4013 domain-containing protein [Atopobiaceae bacterium]MDD3485045.1 DUF4013 domain-containing protein [Atopobiaceae bacterium]